MANLDFRLGVSGVAQVIDGVKAVDNAVGGVGSTAQKTATTAGKSFDTVGVAAQKAASKAVAGFDTIQEAAGKLQSAFGMLAGLSFAGLGLKQLADMADTVTNLRARLELATGSTQSALAKFDQLRDVSNRMQQPLKDVADVYLGISRAAGDLGATQSQLMKFTDGVAASLRLSGTSGAAASGALLQLSQMMGGTNVQAQEFNSLVDGAPVLLRAVAEHIGKTGISMGELRQRVIDGKLPTQEFFQAFLKGADDLKQKAEAMPPTIGGAFTVLKNNLTDLVGRMDDQYKVTGKVSTAILALAKNLDQVKAALQIGAIVLFTYYKQATLIPAVVDLLTAAKTALIGAFTRFQIAAAISGSALGTLTTELVAANAATLTLTGSTSKLAAAFGALGALFVGWEIGTILRENFVEAQLAGIAFVNGTLKGWEAVKYGAQVAWAYIGAAWGGAIEGMGSVLAGFVNKIADGMAALGFDRMAEGLRLTAKLVTEETRNTGDLNAELKGLKDGYEAATAEIDRITDEMADESIAAFNNKGKHEDLAAAVDNHANKKRVLSDVQKGLIKGYADETEKLADQWVELVAGKEASERYQAAKAGVSAESAKAIGLNGQLRDAIKAQTQAEKDAADTKAGIAKVSEKYIADQNKINEGLLAGNASLIEQNDKLRLGDAAWLQREIGLKLAEAADLEWQAANEGGNAQLERQAALLRDRSALLQDGVVLKEAVAAKDAWAKTADEIGKGLTDSLFRAFEAGKGFFSTLWDGIKNLFKTTVLKILISPVQQGMNNLIAGAIGGSQPGYTAGGLLGSASGMASLYSMGQSAYGGLAGYGSAISSYFGLGGVAGGGIAGSGLTAAGSGMTFGGSAYGTIGASSGAYGTIGTAGGTLGTSTAASGTAAAGGGGMSAGAAAGWAAVVAVLSTMAASDFRKGYNAQKAKDTGLPIGKVSGQISDMLTHLGMADEAASILSGSTLVARLASLVGINVTNHQGSVVGIDSAMNASTQYGDGSTITDHFNKDTDTSLRNMGGQSVALLNGLSKMFGGTGGFSALLKYASDGNDASIGQAFINRNGTQAAYVGNGADFAKYAADASVGFTQFSGDVAKATRQAIDAVGLPQWARATFAKLADTATMDDLAKVISEVAAFQDALLSVQDGVAPLGGVFARVAGLSGDALKQLTDFAGGIEAFGAKVGSYVKNYYSEGEQAALSASALKKQLTAAGIDAGTLTDRASFRALVDATDVGNEAGRAKLAALLAAGDSFAALGDYMAKNGGTLADLAALAPTIGALGSLANSDATVQTAESLITLNNTVVTGTQQTVSAIVDLQASSEAGYAAVVGAVKDTNRLLESWNNGGSMLVAVDTGG
jgi:tape measure domain-containing protein